MIATAINTVLKDVLNKARTTGIDIPDSALQDEFSEHDSIYDKEYYSYNQTGDRIYDWKKAEQRLNFIYKKSADEFKSYGINPEDYLKRYQSIGLLEKPFFVLHSGTVPAELYCDTRIVEYFRQYLEKKNTVMLVVCGKYVTVDDDTEQNGLLDLIKSHSNMHFIKLNARKELHAHITSDYVHYQGPHHEDDIKRDNRVYSASKDVVKFMLCSLLKEIIQSKPEIRNDYKGMGIPYTKYLLNHCE